MPAPGDNEQSDKLAGRLRAFFRTLPAQTCVQLLDAIDRAALTGDAVPGSDLIARELRALINTPNKRSSRVGNPSRRFFKIAEPFLIDEELADKHRARIERHSLQSIWTWLKRDLLPAATTTFEETLTEALVAEDNDRIRSTTSEFQKLAIQTMKQTIESRTSESEKRRLVSQVGGPRVHDDLLDLIFILENRDALRAISDRVIGPIRVLDDAQTAFLVGSLTPYLRNGGALMQHAGAIMMSKMTQPSMIVRVITAACDSDNASKVFDTPYASIIDTLLTDIERLVVRATRARRDHELELLFNTARDFAIFVKTFVTDIDLKSDQTWTRRLGHSRGKMGEVLRTQVETLPMRIRWILKAQPEEGPKNDSLFDPQEIQSIEIALDLLALAKSNAAEFAMNEVTLRIHNDIQAFLDSGLNPLLEAMRTAPAEHRAFRIQQLDAGVRMAGKVFGANYASLLQKAADVAIGQDRNKAGRAA